MPNQKAKTKRKRSRRSARTENAQRFFKSISWGEWWNEFATTTQENGKLRYPTAWSLARAKGKTDCERKLIFEAIGPQPKPAPGSKLRVPWLGNWEQRRAQREWIQSDPATHRIFRRVLKERAESMDRIRRAAVLATVQQIGRWQRAAEQIDLSFAGRPYLPNEPPHSARNRARSRAYFRMLKQAQRSQ